MREFIKEMLWWYLAGMLAVIFLFWITYPLRNLTWRTDTLTSTCNPATQTESVVDGKKYVCRSVWIEEAGK